MSEFCSCRSHCNCKCLDSAKDASYEQGWLDCWKFLQSFFATKPAE